MFGIPGRTCTWRAYYTPEQCTRALTIKAVEHRWQGHMGLVTRLTITPMHAHRGRHGMGDACARRAYSATPLDIHLFYWNRVIFFLTPYVLLA
jgi:hypothetical protein